MMIQSANPLSLLSAKENNSAAQPARTGRNQ